MTELVVGDARAARRATRLAPTRNHHPSRGAACAPRWLAGWTISSTSGAPLAISTACRARIETVKDIEATSVR